MDKKQTRIVEHTCDPVYDQTFEFDMLGLIQQLEPMENVIFCRDETTSTRFTAERKIASRVQFLLLVMDWDQLEKSDVLGKIELNTQQRHRRLLHAQQQQQHQRTLTDEDMAETCLDEDENNSGCLATKSANWHDIFYEADSPILCTLQIDNF